ncbi:MAG: ABC transporter substrate-binding protein [Anaerolineales bacterium]|nr:ABC transporter substrate-binding protein [Anaerolineales bacterium]
MKKGFGRRGIVIAVIAVIVIAAVLAVFLRLQIKETVEIGAVLSLSGSASYVGEETRDGMLLAIEEINAWGGIDGRKIELIIEDSQTDPQAGEEAFQRIEAAHQPLLYVASISAVAIALAPLAEENKVVLFGLAATAPELTEPENEWVFRYFPTAKDEVPPVLAILEELGVENLGMIYIDDPFGRSFFALARQELEKSGGMIRGEPYDGKTADFTESIARLKDAEAIYVVVMAGHVKDMFGQLRQEGFEGVIVSAGNASIPSVRSLPEANGVYLVASIIYHPSFLYAAEVKERYEARYGKPFNHYAANGYDLMKLLAGLLAGQEISRQSVKSLLEEGFIYHGVFGALDVEPGEHDIGFPMHPARIVDGEIEYLR